MIKISTGMKHNAKVLRQYKLFLAMKPTEVGTLNDICNCVALLLSTYS